MHAHPRTLNQCRENRDDRNADASQDYVNINDLDSSIDNSDEAYWNDLRLRMIDIDGLSPDQAELRILELRGGKLDK